MHAQNQFRIMEILGDISPAQAKLLFKRLPISFHLRKELSLDGANLDEPLEAYVRGPVVSIFPPAGRFIANTKLAWCGRANKKGGVYVDCVDMLFPGGGQVKTSIRFDPKILGVDWSSLVSGQLTVDIHVYPKEKGGGQKLDVPTYHDDLVTSGAMK